MAAGSEAWVEDEKCSSVDKDQSCTAAPSPQHDLHTLIVLSMETVPIFHIEIGLDGNIV